MKYITQDWTSTKDGYLFFVQRLQEMLFHYSDDIVKAPVHNTQTLLEEYVDTEKDVVKGSIKQYQLDIIAKEIKSSLMTDVIVRELYKYEVIEEMAKFLDKDQRTAVHYIFNKIPKKKYYEICCKYLKENLSESNRKTEIEKGLRAWLAFLLWHGYSSEYIYRFLRNIFEESINDPEKKAQIFLNRFDFEIGKYKVYFVFYEKLKPYQKLLNERLHISFEDDGCFKQIKRKQKSFIGVMETKAYDNYSAMKRAYSALEIFLRYLEVFLNDNISVIGKNGLVIRQDTQEGIILPVKAFGYKSIKPEPRENFKTEIDTIVLGCQEKGKETYSQLNKIVDLHNAALNQQDLNDAFLNLWSALEVASVTDSSKSKIESVTDNIVSILQNDYFECIFSNILDDLKNNLGNRKVSLLLKDITEFDKEICKIAGFIFLEKYEKYREDYFANELKYYPNIRFFGNLLISTALNTTISKIITVPRKLICSRLIYITSFQFTDDLLQVLNLLHRKFFSAKKCRKQLVNRSIIYLINKFICFQILYLFFCYKRMAHKSRFRSFNRAFIDTPLNQCIRCVFIPADFSV